MMSIQDKIRAINKKEKESNVDQIDLEKKELNDSNIINRSRKKIYNYIN